MGDALKGKEMVLLINKGGKMVPVCCSREVSISISPETIEVTKPPQSRWKVFIYGDRAYTISTSGLVTISPAVTINDLFAAIESDQEIQFVCMSDEEHDVFFSGTILITSLEISANYKDVVQYSMSANGSGPLKNNNPYSITILTDEAGNALTDADGHVLIEQEHGDLLPINYDIKCQ